MSSSICGARLIHSPSRCGVDQRVVAEPQRVAARRSDSVEQPVSRHRYSHILGHVVERRVAVDLVGRRVEERVLLVRAAGGDVAGPHHPERDALLAAGVDVAGVAQRHLGVRGVQRADVDVRQPALAADEHLPQRPAALGGLRRGQRRTRRVGTAGGRDSLMRHSPADGARRRASRRRRWRPRGPRHPPRGRRRRCAMRSALHGAVAAQHAPELVPVDRAEVPVAGLLVPAQVGVGQRQAEALGLRRPSCRRTSGAGRRC